MKRITFKQIEEDVKQFSEYVSIQKTYRGFRLNLKGEVHTKDFWMPTTITWIFRDITKTTTWLNRFLHLKTIITT